MNNDQIKGRMKKSEGKIKEVTGKALGNENLEAEGKVDQATGKAQASYGNLKEDIKDTIGKGT